MRITIQYFLLVALSLASASPLSAQTATPAPEPPLRRWVEIQSFTLGTRYRYTETNRDVTTSNHLQYKDSFRARLNADPKKRYTLNVGYFSGNNFTSSWDNWGVGNNTKFDGKNNYFKQLYGAAVPVDGLELQYGGLFVTRGEADEWITYDDDGYVMGERVSVRRPKELYLTEVTVTRAAIGPLNAPNIADRWKGLKHPNYTQVLGVKRFNQRVSASLEYERRIGADYLRPAVTLRFPNNAPISTLRYEQYRRVNQRAAWGLGLWAERPVTKYARVQAGYVSVDQFYGGWNADRMLTGRRVFANATLPIYGPLSASLYVTHAFSEPYTVPIHRRLDAVITYDVLNTLRKTGAF